MPGNLHHARESIRQELSPQALPSVAFVNSIEDAVRDADLVIDCVPDELESKLEIFWLLDRMAPPRTVIATPTIHQSIADLASCTNRREKCIAIAASPESLAAGAATDLLLRAAPVHQRRNRNFPRRFLSAAWLQPDWSNATRLRA